MDIQAVSNSTERTRAFPTLEYLQKFRSSYISAIFVGLCQPSQLDSSEQKKISQGPYPKR